MSPAEFFPEMRPWVEDVINVWPAYLIKPQFAFWQVFHILSLALLGGTAVLMNLRLIGLGLTDTAPAELRRDLWPWMHAGVAGIIVSGVLIGMANAERLYDSTAFTVKMIALLAAVIFTYGVTGPVSAANGRFTKKASAFAAIGVAIWAAALWIFVVGNLINPGAFHILTAAGLIVAIAVKGRLRLAYLAGLGAMVATQFFVTHFVIGLEDLERSDPFNIAFAWILTLWLVGWAIGGAVANRNANHPHDSAAKAAGYICILMWVSAAAAGRWIAFA